MTTTRIEELLAETTRPDRHHLAAVDACRRLDRRLCRRASTSSARSRWRSGSTSASGWRPPPRRPASSCGRARAPLLSRVCLGPRGSPERQVRPPAGGGLPPRHFRSRVAQELLGSPTRSGAPCSTCTSTTPTSSACCSGCPPASPAADATRRAPRVLEYAIRLWARRPSGLGRQRNDRPAGPVLQPRFRDPSRRSDPAVRVRGIRRRRPASSAPRPC